MTMILEEFRRVYKGRDSTTCSCGHEVSFPSRSGGSECEAICTGCEKNYGVFESAEAARAAVEE